MTRGRVHKPWTPSWTSASSKPSKAFTPLKLAQRSPGNYREEQDQRKHQKSCGLHKDLIKWPLKTDLQMDLFQPLWGFISILRRPYKVIQDLFKVNKTSRVSARQNKNLNNNICRRGPRSSVTDNTNACVCCFIWPPRMLHANSCGRTRGNTLLLCSPEHRDNPFLVFVCDEPAGNLSERFRE